jgi:hypothetical protein
MTIYPTIILLNGVDQFSQLDGNLVQHAAFVACTHPKRRNLFSILKARMLPNGMRPESILGNVTRKTLDKLITANLS